MRFPTSRRGSRLLRLLEALEPRTLLTTDLSGTFTAAPTAFLAGSRQAVTLRIDNAGDTNARGTLRVAYYAALDGVTFDPNTAVYLGRTARSANIIPTGNLLITTNLTFSAAFDAGAYRLYAVITPAYPDLETDSSNNTAASDPFAIAQPNYDLTAAFASSCFLPPAIVAGIQKRATVRITITNPSDSTVNIPRSQRITVQVVARPVGATDSSQDVVLRTQLVSVSSLRPGRSTTVAMSLTFPSTLIEGSYDIIVNADTSDALAETNETNNSATFANTLLCTTSFVDPTLTFNATTTLPPSVVADGRVIPLKIDITNLGNINIPSRQTSSISLIAVNLADNSTHALSTFVVNLAGIAPGKTKTFTLKPTVPNAGLDLGTYNIEAFLSTTAPGDFSTNNSGSFSQTLSVDPPYYNIVAAAPTSNFSHTLKFGVVNSGSVSVSVRNRSNTAIPSGTYATVSFALRPSGIADNSQDIAIGSATKSLAGLAIGAARTLSMNVNIPGTVPVGDYFLVATVAPLNLAESTIDDNAAIATAAISIADAFTDIAIDSVITNFPTPTALGSSAMGTVVIRNTGTETIFNAAHRAEIQFWANTGGVFDYQIGSGLFAINLSPGASSVPFNVALKLDLPNDGTVASNVEIYARIANPGDFGDSVSGNNQLSAGTILVSQQSVDLVVQSATDPFPATAPGNSAAAAQVVLTNVASGLASGTVNVKYWASVSGTLDGSEILLGSNTAAVSLLQTQFSNPIAVALTLPNPTVQTTYRLLVQISTVLAVDNNPNNNITILPNTVTVVPV